MTTNVTVKTKIILNGKEYASLDGMPADVRATYERAMATVAAAGQPGASDNSSGGVQLKVHTRSKITINGREYSGPEDMPADVRRLYDRAIADLEPTAAAPLGLVRSPAEVSRAVGDAERATPLGPSSVTQTTAVRVAIGLLLAAILLWLFAR